VGFRPAVYRRAKENGLSGWVANGADGVVIEVQGPAGAVERFDKALRERPPAASEVRGMSSRGIPLGDDSSFEIVASLDAPVVRAEVSADLAVCEDCLRELRDRLDRRGGYPFLNCTACGPRFTIVRGLPYDRSRTTMQGFAMCPLCRAEFEDPGDRRFHAQPNACPACGPRAWLTDASGRTLSERGGEAVRGAAVLLRVGKLVAVKGLGGFHLACDGRDEAAVRRLRSGKHREDKPFALMARDLDVVRRHCRVDAAEAAALTGRGRPIVLLRRLAGSGVALSAAPRQSRLGFMLAYTPLHEMLFDSGCPEMLVMTSGNISEEPIAFKNADALRRLGGLTDAFLLHDRDIRNRCDDSVIRVFRGEARALRRSRGYAPESLPLSSGKGREVLAFGGELKNVFCLLRGDSAYLSQHIGDLKDLDALASFEDALGLFSELLRARPQALACDLHPDYHCTRAAERRAGEEGLELRRVQHHHAHVVSCMADSGAAGRVLGLAFDGAGFGPDGTVWGGELLSADAGGFERLGHLRTVPLPGGDAAVREVWRMGAVWLRESFGGRMPAGAEDMLPELREERWAPLERMIERGSGSPLTSSMGRLFDAVAALIGVRREIRYEGQAAIELEALVRGPEEPYPVPVREERGMLVMDPAPLFRALYEDIRGNADPAVLAARFHAGVAGAAVRLCAAARERTGLSVAALTGGVFQNAVLLEWTAAGLEASGFEVLLHRRVPANDGGLCLGQALIARAGGGTAGEI